MGNILCVLFMIKHDDDYGDDEEFNLQLISQLHSRVKNRM